MQDFNLEYTPNREWVRLSMRLTPEQAQTIADVLSAKTAMQQQIELTGGPEVQHNIEYDVCDQLAGAIEESL